MISSAVPAQACMEAWLNCENLLVHLGSGSNPLSKSGMAVIDECARVCMGTFQALEKGMRHMGDLALICMGICEECAELCAGYPGSLFQSCAAACLNCSRSIAALAATAL